MPGQSIVAPIYGAAEDAIAPNDAGRFDWEQVAAARTSTLDALAGFEKMAEHAEPEFLPAVKTFAGLHQRHADRIMRILADAGHPPEEDGSVMGTVNRLVVATRALFDEIDADVLPQIQSGEEHVLSAYDDALAARLPEDVRNDLVEMRVELERILDEIAPKS